MPIASVLLGDVFAVLSPWRSCARAIRWARAAGWRRGRSRAPPLRYPERLGQWPAVALLVGFAWLELVYVERDSPSILAALSLGYFLVMLAGMLAFGVEEWAIERRRLRRLLRAALADVAADRATRTASCTRAVRSAASRRCRCAPGPSRWSAR